MDTMADMQKKVDTPMIISGDPLMKTTGVPKDLLDYYKTMAGLLKFNTMGEQANYKSYVVCICRVVGVAHFNGGRNDSFKNDPRVGEDPLWVKRDSIEECLYAIDSTE